MDDLKHAVPMGWWEGELSGVRVEVVCVPEDTDTNTRPVAFVRAHGLPPSLVVERRASRGIFDDAPYDLSGTALDRAIFIDKTLRDQARAFARADQLWRAGMLSCSLQEPSTEKLEKMIDDVVTFVARAKSVRRNIRALLLDEVRRGGRRDKIAMEILIDHCWPSKELDSACAVVRSSNRPRLAALAIVGSANAEELRAFVCDNAQDPINRARALERLLPKLPDHEAWKRANLEDTVISLLAADDEKVVAVAVEALTQFGSRAAIPRLRRIIFRGELHRAVAKAIAHIQARIPNKNAGALSVVERPTPSHGRLSFAPASGDLALISRSQTDDR